MILVTTPMKPMLKLRVGTKLDVTCPCCYTRYRIQILHSMGKKINAEYLTPCCNVIITPQARQGIVHLIY